MIKAIIFDLDNTLLDFMKMKRAAVDAAADAMIDSGLNISKEKLVEKIYSIYWKEGIEDQQIFDKVLFQEFGYIDYKILAAGILGYRRAKDSHLCTYPHVYLTLTELLKRGIKMCVISDAPRLPVWMRIVALNLQHYFEFVLTYEDTGEKKPSPKPFVIALERLQTLPQQTMMVGDWVERDIVGAKNLNLITIFAKYGDEFNVQNSGADYEINDIIELLDIVDKHKEKDQLLLFQEKK
ncbi:MAG: HAD-IA family hydrolase [Endomicrobia bacterium]|nr:HAD-IA family hydrolase [Endomicrobiia bacterium]